MLIPTLAWTLAFFFVQDGREFRSEVEGVPTARYCRALGRENAPPDIGWRCSREESQQAFIRRLLSPVRKGRRE